MVVINSNEEVKTLDTKRFKEATIGNTFARDVISGKAFEIDASWKLPGKTALVLELK
jgi:hypothetical protein